jgi:predicted phosphodiesterase
MKLAIISDIHGNIHALDAVLRDIDALGVDQVVVNGDLVNRNPNNVRVMERLAERRYPTTLGNHDDLLRLWVDRDARLPGEWFSDPFWEGTAWSARQVADAGWMDSLRDLPMTYRIEPPGAPSVLISHGSPRHYREGYSWYLTDQDIADIVAAYPADVLIGSHIHRSLERAWNGHIVLNTGAVGAPFNGNPRAQYLLLTLQANAWTWEFRAVPYDHVAALAAFEEMGYLEEGGLSAFIFYEELRYARAIYAPFWGWAESNNVLMNWNSWREFYEEFEPNLTLPPPGGLATAP